MEGREMGNELDCTARLGKQSGKGKALLETNEILFRGEFRLKIPIASIQSVKAVDGELRVQTAQGLAVFELGDAAEKWREKILHPKSRLEKLGVKPGAAVSLIGTFEAEFLRELREQTLSIAKGKAAAGAEWLFFAADSAKALARVSKLAKAMTGAAALWIVYPKGQKQITENDVLASGRKAGLKDVKVVSFSSTHTGLKFVIPLDRR
jgi:Fe2+ transport system protein FeoA